MDTKKPISVGVTAALVDLKAELLRKQSELKLSKGQSRGAPKTVKRSELAKAKVSVKNRGVASRSQKDLQADPEEERTWEKAKNVLEAKAALYDKMTTEALGHDEHEHPVLSTSLVNFQQKAIDRIQSKEAVRSGTGNLMDTDNTPVFIPTPDEEEEWTEFIDSFGRTRRCLKKDLPIFQARDEEFSRPSHSHENPAKNVEDEMRLQKHEQWEKEAAEAAAKSQVHYQDVLFDEIRAHGVGYFGFSKDEGKRAEEMLELKKLSAETTATRQVVMEARSKSKSNLKARLAKIRQKKRSRLGLPPTDEKDDDDDEPEVNNAVSLPSPEIEIPGPKPSTSKPEVRAWDFGKRGVPMPSSRTQAPDFQELDAKWLRDRRNDRVQEFAPPSSYKK